MSCLSPGTCCEPNPGFGLWALGFSKLRGRTLRARRPAQSPKPKSPKAQKPPTEALVAPANFFSCSEGFFPATSFYRVETETSWITACPLGDVLDLSRSVGSVARTAFAFETLGFRQNPPHCLRGRAMRGFFVAFRNTPAGCRNSPSNPFSICLGVGKPLLSLWSEIFFEDVGVGWGRD